MDGDWDGGTGESGYGAAPLSFRAFGTGTACPVGNGDESVTCLYGCRGPFGGSSVSLAVPFRVPPGRRRVSSRRVWGGTPYGSPKDLDVSPSVRTPTRRWSSVDRRSPPRRTEISLRSRFKGERDEFQCHTSINVREYLGAGWAHCYYGVGESKIDRDEDDGILGTTPTWGGGWGSVVDTGLPGTTVSDTGSGRTVPKDDGEGSSQDKGGSRGNPACGC